MSIERLKQFVFNGLLLGDSLVRLEEQGIGVRGKPGNEEAVAGLEDTYFSPRIVYDANRMASVYVAFFPGKRR